MTDLKLPPIADDEFLYISNEGLKRLTQSWDSKNPQKNFNWTTDYTLEMPIRLKKTGPGTSFLLNPYDHPLSFFRC